MKIIQSQNYQQSVKLPSVASGCARITHFTGCQIANRFLSGQNFNYGKSGLSQTVDFHGDHGNTVDELLGTGKIGVFTRSGFGECVLIMDVPFLYLKKMDSFNFRSDGDFVPNQFIVGVFNRKTQQFSKNGKFDPNHKMTFVPVSKTPRKEGKPVEIPAPSQNDKEIDVW